MGRVWLTQMVVIRHLVAQRETVLIPGERLWSKLFSLGISVPWGSQCTFVHLEGFKQRGTTEDSKTLPSKIS